MTDTTNPAAPERVEAINMDREAAAARFDRQAAFPGHPSAHTAQMVRDGKFDGHEWVQEFARHRLAALANPSGEDPLVRQVERRAYRAAYAPLRSAQHALDIIASSRRSERDLAREESERIGTVLAALAQSITSGKGGE